jgi:hypothetical protein
MIVRPDPDPTLAVLQQRIDKIRMDHPGIMNKTMPGLVKTFHPSAPGPHPDITPPVFYDRSDEITGEAKRILRDTFINVKIIPVIPV